jgi:hypothetical protein
MPRIIFPVGQLVRLTRLPPNNFVGTYKGTPIIYNIDAQSLVYAHVTGWRKLDVSIFRVKIFNSRINVIKIQVLGTQFPSRFI